MEGTEQSSSNAPSYLTKVPIAELSPSLERPADKSILATVILVWPYSSATKSLSLLLAEPDCRLRHSRGQIKVIFHGHVAEKVAESHVGIGDSVCLGLNGSKFTGNEVVQQSPGRSIAWDAHFESNVCLEVFPTLAYLPCFKSAAIDQKARIGPPTIPRSGVSNRGARDTRDDAAGS